MTSTTNLSCLWFTPNNVTNVHMSVETLLVLDFMYCLRQTKIMNTRSHLIPTTISPTAADHCLGHLIVEMN